MAKDSGKKIEIKQIKSAAGRNKRVLAGLACLGLGRIGKKKVIPSNPATQGMVKKLAYLLEIKNLD